MKLLCSVLILAGVFALNDASLSYEDQMRIVNDQLMLEELKNIAMNRDVDSRKCSTQLIESMTATLGIYNDALSACNQTKQEALAAIDEAAKQKLLEMDKAIQGTCESLNKCSSLDDALDSLACFQEESSQSAKVCTSVSNAASSGKIEMRTQIENCEGNEDICKSNCFSDYSRSSDKNNQDFADCMNGKSSDDGEKPSTTSTQAPESEATIPDEEEEPKEEESKEEQEKDDGGRRPKMASNKHWRF